MELFAFEHLHRNNVVYVALYDPVHNAETIRRRIIAAATAEGENGDAERDAVNFAFIDASLISSSLHLQTAIYQSILAESQGTLRTKTIHSEILWYLNPTNNITEAIRRYGVSDDAKALFVVHISDTFKSSREDIQSRMNAVIQGEPVPLSSLGTITDWKRIKKYNRLNDSPRDNGTMDNILVTSVAMKNVTG